MIQKKKNLKFRKISEKVKKLGGTITASNAQLERLFNEQHIKYVMCIEDQLQEDKAHLLLKQQTIEILQDDVKLKNRKLRQIEIFQKKLAKKLNTREDGVTNKIELIKARMTDYFIIKHDLKLLSKRMGSITELEAQIKYLKEKNNSNRNLS